MADESVGSSEGASEVEGQSAETQNYGGYEDQGYSAPEQHSSGQDSEALKKKVAYYDAIDERYRKDSAFRAKFDAVWNGQADEGRQNRSANPLDALRSEIDNLKHEIKNRDDLYSRDKLNSHKNTISSNYAEHFTSMAENVGYDYGSEAYEILFDSTEKVGRNLARKYGLVDANGAPDPSLRFNPKFLKEAFDIAYDKHKKAGFDDGWKRKQDAIRSDRAKKNASVDELSPYFKPELLKDSKSRATQLQKAFNHHMKNQGLNFRDLKII